MFLVTLCGISTITGVGSLLQLLKMWHMNFRTLQNKIYTALLFFWVSALPLDGVLLNVIVMLILQDAKPLMVCGIKSGNYHLSLRSKDAVSVSFKNNFQTVVSLSSCFNEINCLPQQLPWQYSKRKVMWELCVHLNQWTRSGMSHLTAVIFLLPSCSLWRALFFSFLC